MTDELVEKNVPHETLIRHNEDGSVRGAQYETRHIIRLGDRELKNDYNDPIPLHLVTDPADKDTLRAVLDETTLQALADITRANTRIAELEQQLVAAIEELKRRDELYSRIVQIAPRSAPPQHELHPDVS